jgi:hypothetical protein
MNAYELTKELSEFMTEDKYTDLDKTIFKTCNMLRQQADRIERKQELIREQTALLVKQNNRIAELEKELYFKNYYEELPDTPVGIIGKIGDSPIHDLVHRTTPQIKELSDEEILNLYKETEADNGGIREFARAILKKASEK